MDPTLLVIIPIILPLLAAAVLPFLPRIGRYLTPVLFLIQLLATTALAVQVFAGGSLVYHVGAWPVPYGIVLVADPFATLLLAASSLVFFASSLAMPVDRGPSLYSLLFLLKAGVTLSFVTGDLFNLFVAFELMLTASYALLVTQGQSKRPSNAYGYLISNILASFLYLIAVAAFYGTTGSLNFASLSLHLSQVDLAAAQLPMLMIVLVMLVKGGVFPLYFWLPDSYPLLPAPLAALFGGILTKVGVYGLYRLVFTVFPGLPWLMEGLLPVLAGLTMLLGVLGAVSKGSIKEILSYHILSQVGYMVLALCIGTPLAVTAGILFIVHNILVKSSLFLIGGIAEAKCQSKKLDQMGGLWAAFPWFGGLFMLQAFALVGIPPLSGFWGKYLIIFEGVVIESYTLAAVAALTGFLTLFSMIKIWNAAFLCEAKGELAPSSRLLYVGPVILMLVALGMGLFPQRPIELAERASGALIDRDSYISKVFE